MTRALSSRARAGARGRAAVAAAVAVAAATLAGLAGGGCAGPPRSADPAAFRPVGEPDPAQASELGARDLYPTLFAHPDRLEPAAARFRVVSGEHAGADAVRTLRAVADDDALAPEGARWVLEWSIEGVEPSPLQATFLMIDEAGALVSPRVVNADRDSITDFEPPLVAVPASMAAGEPVEREHAMVVRAFGDPSRVTQRGEGTNTLTLRGAQAVEAGDRRLDGVRLDTRFRASFGPADVDRTTRRWYAHSDGSLLAEAWDESIKVFGLVTERRTRAAVRAD